MWFDRLGLGRPIMPTGSLGILYLDGVFYLKAFATVSSFSPDR